MNKATRRILARPIAEWPQALNSTRANLHEIERDLAQLVQRAALLNAYVERIACGGADHTFAARSANRQLVRIRRAMRFSYPNQLPISIQE